MRPSGIQQIAVVCGNSENYRLFFAALTEVMINNYVSHHNRHIDISMRQRGLEILQGSEDTEEGMMASDRAKQFSFLDISKIPNEWEVVLRNENQYCGTVCFSGASPDVPIKKYRDIIDTVLILIDKKTVSIPEEYVRKLISDSVSGVCFALKCDSPIQGQESAEEFVKNNFSSLYSLLAGRLSAFCWYHPYGFQPNGEPKPAEDATPYGIDELFWNVMRISATMRINYLQQLAEEKTEIIRKRNSVFQRNSMRRVLELNRAREAYSMAVQSMYAVEQLLAVTEGSALVEDAPIKE